MRSSDYGSGPYASYQPTRNPEPETRTRNRITRNLSGIANLGKRSNPHTSTTKKDHDVTDTQSERRPGASRSSRLCHHGMARESQAAPKAKSASQKAAAPAKREARRRPHHVEPSQTSEQSRRQKWTPTLSKKPGRRSHAIASRRLRCTVGLRQCHQARLSARSGALGHDCLTGPISKPGLFRRTTRKPPRSHDPWPCSSLREAIAGLSAKSWFRAMSRPDRQAYSEEDELVQDRQLEFPKRSRVRKVTASHERPPSWLRRKAGQAQSSSTSRSAVPDPGGPPLRKDQDRPNSNISPNTGSLPRDSSSISAASAGQISASCPRDAEASRRSPSSRTTSPPPPSPGDKVESVFEGDTPDG